MHVTQLSLPLNAPAPFAQANDPALRRTPTTPPQPDSAAPTAAIASGEKTKARDIIAAIRALKRIEEEKRPATREEKQTLARFAGFGPVALSIFPDPVSGRYKDASWQALGEELQALLTQAEHDSAKRTTFNAFYTSPTVITAMHEAIARLGVPDGATILEPGCGSGNFMSHGKPGTRFIGIELDSTSGRIARALHPEHDIRIENFRDSKLPEDRIDAVIGNVPFADLKLDYHGQKLSLHDYFFAKSIDALKPGGVLALVTSHFTLDKQNAAIREYLASKADFVGAIRLPSDAFKREGTAVVTDILFLRKRAPASLPTTSMPTGWALPRFPSRTWKSQSTATLFATRKWSSAPGQARTRSTARATASSPTATPDQVRPRLWPGSSRQRSTAFPNLHLSRYRRSRTRRLPRHSRRRHRSGTSAKGASLLGMTASFTNPRPGKGCPSSMAARRSGRTVR